MKKRVVSLLLCLIMALSLIPTAAFATEGVDADSAPADEVQVQEAATDEVAVQKGGGGTDYSKVIDWKQFYGYTTYNYMSNKADETAGKCSVYYGTTEWPLDTFVDKDSTIRKDGITIKPATGYYVKQVVIACNDEGGYHCDTARRDGIVKFGNSSTQSADFVIPADNLVSSKHINGNPVWHDGWGYPNHLMIWLAKSPNPAEVIYDAGDMSDVLSGKTLITYDPSEKQPDDVVMTLDYPQPEGNTITYQYDREKSKAQPQHTILDMLDTFKTVKGSDGKTYTFTGWKAYSSVDAAGSESWNPVTGSSAVGDKLTLYANYKLVAQWKEVEITTGSLTVKKEVTGLTGTDIPSSFTINVKGTGTSTYDEIKTVTADNSVTFENLPFGSYTITEANADVNGYTWTKNISNENVTIGSSNPNPTVTVTNTYTQKAAETKIVSASLTIKKVDSDTKAVLTGAVFEMRTSTEATAATVGTFDTATNTITGINQAGTFYLYETTAPAGYVKPSNAVATVTVSESTVGPVFDVERDKWVTTKTYSINSVSVGTTPLTKDNNGAYQIENTRATGNLTIVKRLNTALLQDMTFKFNVMQGTSAPITAEIAIKAGDLQGSTTVSGLKLGTKYTVQEDTSSAQVSGYKLTAPADQNVTINATGAQVEFENKYTKDTTSVTVTKEWELNGISEAQHPAKVTVQLMQGNKAYGDPVELYATNDWTYTWTDLDVYNATGSEINYTVKEISAPKGFTAVVKSVATADHPTFTITNTANVAEEAEVTPASLTVIKTDAKDGSLLEGAKFVLIREGAVATDSPFVTTGKDGKAVFTGLTKGTYTLKEVTAPEGYQATDETWTITVSDDAQTAGYVLKGDKFVKTITCKVDDMKDVVTNGSITITNVKATGTVTINKVLKGLNATDFKDGFAFDIKDASGKVVATVTNVFPNMAQPATVTLAPGKYTIVEKSADVKDYDLTTEYDKQTFTVEADKNVTVTVTNTYTKQVTPPPAEYTLSVDIQKNIELKRSSSRKPGKASFTFEAYLVDGNGKETVLDTVTIDTKGTKSADGKLTFTLTEDDLSVTGHGTVYVREVKGDTRGWTYDDTVYALGVQLTDGKLSIISVDTKHIDKPATLEFTNVYYKRSTTTGGNDKPIKSVKTGDMGIAMYAMTSLLSLGGAALVIKKRKEEK